MSDRSNLPLPDQLAAIRSEIKRLEGLEVDLRNELMAHPELREGASWLAEVKATKRMDVDLKELRACHPDLVAEFTFPREITRIVLSGVTSEGEIINARAMRKLEADQQ